MDARLVKDSLGIDGLISKLRKNNNNIIWYVDRRARILKFEPSLLNKNTSVGTRRSKLKVTVFDIFKEKWLYKNKVYSVGQFYDTYYKYGHFFKNHNAAVRYIHKRVKTGRSDIVKSATKYIENYPECLI